MGDSVTDLPSSSRTSKPSSVNPRFSHDDSREADENDQMVLKIQNPKRPSMKHFMAPTMSAISRNKILTERNESLDSSETHLKSTSNLVPKAHFRKSSNFSETSSNPYDPLTNYLSPRPKFLRYNPNRHRKMSIQRETEIGKNNEGFDGLSSSSLESSNETENEETDIVDHGLEADDEENDDFEKEGCFSLKGVFKFLLVSVTLLLLTWYISCMSSSASFRIMHLKRGSFYEYISSYNHTHDIANEGFSKIVDEKPNGINNFFYQAKRTEITESIEKFESFYNYQSDLVRNYVSENSKYQELDLEVEGDNYNEGIQVSETENNGAGLVKIIDEKPNEMNEAFDQMKGTEIIESAEKFESFQDDLSELGENYVFQNSEYQDLDTEVEGVDHEEGIQVSEVEDQSESIYVSENEAKENSVSMDSTLETETETIIEVSVQGEGKVVENKNKSVDITENSKSNVVYGAFIGIFMIISSLVLTFRLRHKRKPIAKSQPIVKPLQNPLPAKKISSEGPSHSNMEKSQLEKVDLYANCSTYFPSIEENLNNFPLTRAPKVELLGEFMVGDFRNSMKSCSVKNKTNEMELEETKEMKLHAETKTIFVDKAINSKTHMSTPEFSVSATMVSSSYGSYTPAKKIVKDEEVSVKTSTPVRRSSRIKNRAISP